MYFGIKSDSRIPPPKTQSFRDFGAHFPVFSPEEQQGIPLPYNDILYLGDEDRVVASRLGGMQTAFKIRQCSMQDWRSMGSAIESRSGFGFGILVSTFGARVILRDASLILAEHINPKALLGVKMCVCPRAVIYAHQHQRRVE
jgi:hypothetical protein